MLLSLIVLQSSLSKRKASNYWIVLFIHLFQDGFGQKFRKRSNPLDTANGEDNAFYLLPYPFTAPAVIPSTKYRCTAANRMITGIVVIVPSAMMIPQSMWVELI